MPTTLVLGPYRFSFVSSDCVEPRHTHVRRDDDTAKFWLDPVQLASSNGFSRKELRDIERVILAHIDLLKGKWDEHCAGSTH